MNVAASRRCRENRGDRNGRVERRVEPVDPPKPQSAMEGMGMGGPVMGATGMGEPKKGM